MPKSSVKKSKKKSVKKLVFKAQTKVKVKIKKAPTTLNKLKEVVAASPVVTPKPVSKPTKDVALHNLTTQQQKEALFGFPAERLGVVVGSKMKNDPYDTMIKKSEKENPMVDRNPIIESLRGKQ